MTAKKGKKIVGGGMKQKGERTHRHGQQCGNSVEEVGIRELNGNGKNTIKIIKT